MNAVKSIAAAAIVLAAGSSVVAVAQDKNDRTVDQYTCKDVMRESGPHRDVSIAFLHGYLLGKAGTASFNLEVLAKQTDAFVDHCLDNPGDKAADAMMKVKK